MRKELEKQVKAIDRRLETGDIILLKYEGQEIARYEFIERSIDCKTPLHWLRGCLCFNVELQGRDINKVSLELVSKT